VSRSLARQDGRGEEAEARFEREANAFHERVRRGYEALAAAEPRRVLRLSAEGTPGEVAVRVWDAVADLFGEE